MAFKPFTKKAAPAGKPVAGKKPPKGMSSMAAETKGEPAFKKGGSVNSAGSAKSYKKGGK